MAGARREITLASVVSGTKRARSLAVKLRDTDEGERNYESKE
jgi:hypothetical protein